MDMNQLFGMIVILRATPTLITSIRSLIYTVIEISFYSLHHLHLQKFTCFSFVHCHYKS